MRSPVLIARISLPGQLFSFATSSESTKNSFLLRNLLLKFRDQGKKLSLEGRGWGYTDQLCTSVSLSRARVTWEGYGS